MYKDEAFEGLHIAGQPETVKFFCSYRVSITKYRDIQIFSFQIVVDAI